MIYYEKPPFDLTNKNFARYLETAALFLDYDVVDFYHVDVDRIAMDNSNLELPFIRIGVKEKSGV